MEPRLSLVTLGVASMARARAFYEALGWTASGASQAEVAFFQLGPMVLSLFGRADLAADAGVPESPSGFQAVSLAQNYDTPEAVDRAFAAGVAAGATALKAPQATPWGGYAGTLADPDGHLWELAHNPFFPLAANGQVTLSP